MDTATKKRKAAPEASPLEKRKPVTSLRREDCSASIWTRSHVVQGVPTTFYSVTLERSYKDNKGAWKYTNSFDPDNLGKVVTLCQEAQEVIQSLQEKGSGQ